MCWVSHSRHTLEIQPLLCQPRLVAVRFEAQSVLGVVLLNQILDDGARFPECEVCVRVVDRGHTAVGVNGGELGLLDVGEVDRFELVRNAELFNQHAHFDRVRSGSPVENDGFDGCHDSEGCEGRSAMCGKRL